MPYKHLPKQFQGIVEATEYKDPKIDIEEDVREYVDGVIHNPSDEQEYLVKQFTENSVNLALHEWKGRYRQNDEIIENIEDHHAANSKNIKSLETEKENEEKKLNKLKSIKHENEKHIEDVERATPSSDLNKKGTLIFLIMVAVGLAILTAYKFSTAMGAIASETEGHTISTLQFLLYGLGSLAILATGKILNIIYEKLHYNKVFFLAVAISAIVLSGVSIYYLAGDKAFLNTKAYVTKDLKKIKIEISDIEPEPGESLSVADEKLFKKLKEKEDKLSVKLSSMKEDAIALDRIMLILILFTEMFVGGIAWMYATDYTRYLNEDKRSHSIDSVTRHIEDSDKKQEIILSKIKNIDEEIDIIRLENHDLHRVIANIKTEKEIDEIVKLIIENESNKALSYLWKKSNGTV